MELDYYNRRQIELVEFSEKVYHNGLRHTGINGGLYEDILIKYLREDIPELTFFKGQIRTDNNTSSQYDIIICKKNTLQKDFLKEINPYINIVDREDCLGVIEVKKWANPKMISCTGDINRSCELFRSVFLDLKYMFVCFRFKDRKKVEGNSWENCKSSLNVNGKFCFWGNTYPIDKEWEFPWIDNKLLIERNRSYSGEYHNLVKSINNLI
jgi:hypothetical protein